jgi:hypothetical protein
LLDLGLRGILAREQDRSLEGVCIGKLRVGGNGLLDLFEGFLLPAPFGELIGHSVEEKYRTLGMVAPASGIGGDCFGSGEAQRFFHLVGQHAAKIGGRAGEQGDGLEIRIEQVGRGNRPNVPSAVDAEPPVHRDGQGDLVIGKIFGKLLVEALGEGFVLGVHGDRGQPLVGEFRDDGLNGGQPRGGFGVPRGEKDDRGERLSFAAGEIEVSSLDRRQGE